MQNVKAKVTVTTRYYLLPPSHGLSVFIINLETGHPQWEGLGLPGRAYEDIYQR